MVEQRFCKP